MYKLLLIFAMIGLNIMSAFAQSGEIEMATGLRSSGKIWVVVMVLLTIVIALFIYLFSMDRRIKKLEDNK